MKKKILIFCLSLYLNSFIFSIEDLKNVTFSGHIITKEEPSDKTEKDLQ